MAQANQSHPPARPTTHPPHHSPTQSLTHSFAQSLRHPLPCSRSWAAAQPWHGPLPQAEHVILHKGVSSIRMRTQQSPMGISAYHSHILGENCTHQSGPIRVQSDEALYYGGIKSLSGCSPIQTALKSPFALRIQDLPYVCKYQDHSRKRSLKKRTLCCSTALIRPSSRMDWRRGARSADSSAESWPIGASPGPGPAGSGPTARGPGPGAGARCRGPGLGPGAGARDRRPGARGRGGGGGQARGPGPRARGPGRGPRPRAFAQGGVRAEASATLPPTRLFSIAGLCADVLLHSGIGLESLEHKGLGSFNGLLALAQPDVFREQRLDLRGTRRSNADASERQRDLRVTAMERGLRRKQELKAMI